MKKLNKTIKKEIQEFVEQNQPIIDWDSDSISQETIKTILEKGMDEYIDELCEINLEYMWELEDYLVQEIKKEWDEYDPDKLEEFSREFIHVGINMKHFYSLLPNITCLAYVYSNYDCCNSFDIFADNEYLADVYNRVKEGVKKEDYLYEFQNGVYGGCVFCFAFKTDIEDLLELLEQIKTGKEIFIPEGTQFGFFSSFQGSGTPFEKRTFKNMTLPLIGETEHDTIYITPDITQSYNMDDVYGDSSFIDESNIEIK